MNPTATTTSVKVTPDKVHEVLGKYMLADGFEFDAYHAAPEEARRGGLVRGGAAGRENRAALPDTVFVGCQQGFNKHLMGTIVTMCPSSTVYIVNSGT